MTIIGTFTKNGERFEGTIQTLTFKARVSFVPMESDNDQAPNYRVFAGPAELGAAWSKQSETSGNAYLSVKLDDPSFTAPIFARLIDAQDKGWQLVWSRSN
jgi:uncharacterized protein (DUF736 family)